MQNAPSKGCSKQYLFNSVVSEDSIAALACFVAFGKKCAISFKVGQFDFPLLPLKKRRGRLEKGLF